MVISNKLYYISYIIHNSHDLYTQSSEHIYHIKGITTPFSNAIRLSKAKGYTIKMIHRTASVCLLNMIQINCYSVSTFAPTFCAK